MGELSANPGGRVEEIARSSHWGKFQFVLEKDELLGVELLET